MDTFNALPLPEALLHCLRGMGFEKPTPIQAKAIPFALDGRDILGSAQTGTGKTGAFCIPMLAHLIANPNSSALIMTPTRELAAQVVAAAESMLPPSARIKTALLIGGASMGKQLQQLRARPRIVVGTPGRINDHLGQGSVRFDTTDYLVLDETDRMLDMGFEVQIDRIVSRLPKKRQTLLFSATLPKHIVQMSEKYLNKPERVAVGSTHTPIEKIKQELYHVAVADKFNKLMEQLQARTGTVIVFVRTKRGADKLARRLNDAKMGADAIHGDLSQNKRNRVIQDYRDKRFRILVATDVAARGLDIPHLEHVINYDLPQVPEDYIHRIGRTARAGATGFACCFITPEDTEMWREIHRLMNPGDKTVTELPQRGPQRGPQRKPQHQGQRKHGQQGGQRGDRKVRSYGGGGHGGHGGQGQQQDRRASGPGFSRRRKRSRNAA